jgi:hypothetical protein
MTSFQSVPVVTISFWIGGKSLYDSNYHHSTSSQTKLSFKKTYATIAGGIAELV